MWSWAWGSAAFAAGFVVAWLAGQDAPGSVPDGRQTASAAEVSASLARGVAWIWPDSNGPLAAAGGTASYREAAVLVEALALRDGRVEHRSRTRPLALPEGVGIVPVVHVEPDADASAPITPAQHDAIVAAVRRHAPLAASGARLLQLDFEAPGRARAAYRQLVADVRRALPADVRLSVTALAHWCTQGDWLDSLPVDEVVPMLYRLGPHAERWRSRFERDDAALARRCRGPALGFATNDPPPPRLLARAARAYWFDESAWSNPSHPPPHLYP